MDSLYRFYRSDDSLLYVGISVSVAARLAQHSKSAEWFTDIKRVEVESFHSRAEALEAERVAIKTESPLFNVSGSYHDAGSLVALQTIGRVRRAMPRNADAMLLCDELERLLAASICEECERRRKQTRDRVAKLRKKRAKT